VPPKATRAQIAEHSSASSARFAALSPAGSARKKASILWYSEAPDLRAKKNRRWIASAGFLFVKTM
jgi:hypothetical protein